MNLQPRCLRRRNDLRKANINSWMISRQSKMKSWKEEKMHFLIHSIIIPAKPFRACTSRKPSLRDLDGMFLNSACFASTMDFQSNLNSIQFPQNKLNFLNQSSLTNIFNFALFQGFFHMKTTSQHWAKPSKTNCIPKYQKHLTHKRTCKRSERN